MRLLAALAALGAVITAASAAEAQVDGRRWYAGIIIGPGAAIGGFADSPTASPGAGPATSGYLDTFANVAYRTGAHGGIAASLAYGEFGMSSGDDDWWQVTVLTIGPMYVRPIAQKLDLELKAKGGMMATVEVIDSFESVKGVGFALDLRGGLRYDLFRRWSALAEVGIVSSSQTFDAGGSKGVHALVSGIGIVFRW